MDLSDGGRGGVDISDIGYEGQSDRCHKFSTASFLETFSLVLPTYPISFVYQFWPRPGVLRFCNCVML